MIGSKPISPSKNSSEFEIVVFWVSVPAVWSQHQTKKEPAQKFYCTSFWCFPTPDSGCRWAPHGGLVSCLGTVDALPSLHPSSTPHSVAGHRHSVSVDHRLQQHRVLLSVELFVGHHRRGLSAGVPVRKCGPYQTKARHPREHDLQPRSPAAASSPSLLRRRRRVQTAPGIASVSF